MDPVGPHLWLWLLSQSLPKSSADDTKTSPWQPLPTYSAKLRMKHDFVSKSLLQCSSDVICHPLGLLACPRTKEAAHL